MQRSTVPVDRHGGDKTLGLCHRWQGIRSAVFTIVEFKEKQHYLLVLFSVSVTILGLAPSLI